MMSIRSHYQFNTTIYGLTTGTCRAQRSEGDLHTPADSVAGLTAHSRRSHILQGGDARAQRSRRAVGFLAMRRNLLPGGNVLVSVNSFAARSNTPRSRYGRHHCCAVGDEAPVDYDAWRPGGCNAPAES